MKIAVVGSGYVGPLSRVCFAEFGHDVFCFGKNKSKIDLLRVGIMSIYWPDLGALVKSNLKAERLSFTTNLAAGTKEATAIFIALGTPSRRGEGHTDLTYAFEVARDLGKKLANDAVVVTKSTVPVRTTSDEVKRIIHRMSVAHSVSVVFNPEFLRGGAASADFKHPERIVIGAEDDYGREVMGKVYRPLFLNKSPILLTSRRTSELTKYAANAFITTKITFINEIASLCEKVGANVQDVSRGIGIDHRIGSRSLKAGPGYGGSCFPKYTRVLFKTAADYDSTMRIVEAVVKVNQSRESAMERRVIDALCGEEAARGKKSALLGLTFKPSTDDIRVSLAIIVAQMLMETGIKVAAYDPEDMEQDRHLMPAMAYGTC
jgi:UDPglucose 6-dehydrogenase